MRTLAMVGIVIAVENAAFVALCLAKRPENDYAVAIIYLSWMIIPALTGAIGAINRRWSAIATGMTSMVSVTCWIFLVIAKRLFWDESLRIENEDSQQRAQTS